jgi:hypothetical protein
MIMHLPSVLPQVQLLNAKPKRKAMQVNHPGLFVIVPVLSFVFENRYPVKNGRT